jgi:peptidoglycan/LPS O-acetylase OafA/YrhL
MTRPADHHEGFLMKSQNSETRPTINALKGIAISAVLINHYINRHFSFDATGFGNLFIALFYMASGYGLHYSLGNYFPDGTTFSKKAMLRFYLDRAVRIYPLFWIALLAFQIYSIKAFLGLNAPGIFWFIPTLLQCYALAPFIFLGIKNNIPVTITITILIFIVINCLPHLGYYTGQLIVQSASIVRMKWAGIYLGYLLMFTFGLLLPCFLSTIQVNDHIYTRMLFILHLAATLCFMIWLKCYVSNKVLFVVPSILALVLLFIHAIRCVVRFRFLAYIGSISYSIYLFHIPFYKTIHKIGFAHNSWIKIAICLALFPLFLYACDKLEGVSKYIAEKLRVSLEKPFFNKISSEHLTN